MLCGSAMKGKDESGAAKLPFVRKFVRRRQDFKYFEAAKYAKPGRPS